MENLMKKVANLLGVELDEEFEIIFPQPSNCHATAKLTIDGAKVIKTNVYEVINFKSYLLEHLIRGCYGIKRKPWKPKHDEGYYYVDEEGHTYRSRWDDSDLSDHMNYYKFGNCYKTKEEAEANSSKWLSFYASDEILEV